MNGGGAGGGGLGGGGAGESRGREGRGGSDPEAERGLEAARGPEVLPSAAPAGRGQGGPGERRRPGKAPGAFGGEAISPEVPCCGGEGGGGRAGWGRFPWRLPSCGSVAARATPGATLGASPAPAAGSGLARLTCRPLVLPLAGFLRPSCGLLSLILFLKKYKFRILTVSWYSMFSLVLWCRSSFTTLQVTHYCDSLKLLLA